MGRGSGGRFSRFAAGYPLSVIGSGEWGERDEGGGGDSSAAGTPSGCDRRGRCHRAEALCFVPCPLQGREKQGVGVVGYYSEPATSSGGRMSQDFTSGYGPEEFLIHRALPGGYRVQVNYYGNRQQVLAGATTVQAVLITNWGRPNEKREAVTLRLQDAEDVVKVGELLFGGE